MKYLRLFENFNSGFREISYGSRGPVSKGIKKFSYNNKEKLTDSDISRIKTFLRGYNVDRFEIEISRPAGLFTRIFTQQRNGTAAAVPPDSIGSWIPYKDIKPTKKFIRIEKYKDEWFIIKDHPFFYECDQIDGVINCLKTLLPNKLDESLDIKPHYYKTSQDEFDKTIQNPDIYFFSNQEISALKNLIGSKFTIKTEDASIITFGSQFTDAIWFISDNWGLDKQIKSEEIRIHNDHNIEKYTVSETSDDDTIIIKNFTIRLIPNDKKKEPIDIMKCNDEWFLICVGIDNEDYAEKMYKCDQLEGVIKFIEDMYEIY